MTNTTTTTITSVNNIVYANEIGNAVDCDITTTQFGDEVLPYTATSYDPEPFGRDFFNALKAGVYGPIAPYVPPPEVAENQPFVIGAQTL
jgi:hypothetical protein